MSADNMKWQVNRGIRASNLPPNARLIMWTLSDMADAETGIIPMKRSPSLADLARETGLGESTVKAQLASLEALGWVRRSRPTASERARHMPTYYEIRVGSAGAERAPLKRKPRARSKPSNEVSEGQEMALAEGQDIALENESEGQEIAPRGPGDSPPRARRWPSYLKDDDLDDLDDLKASATSADAPPKASRRGGKPKPPPPPPREDVMRVCNHLADRIHANGSKRPDFGKTWLDAARLMLDRDGPDGTGIPEADVHAAIDWCQNSTFWRGNVMSLPKLREKYDQMRLQAQRPAQGRTTGQQRLDDAARIAADMRALDEAEAAGTYQPPILYALPPGRSA